jgi:uncharacterized membrane protein YgcG
MEAFILQYINSTINLKCYSTDLFFKKMTAFVVFRSVGNRPAEFNSRGDSSDRVGDGGAGGGGAGIRGAGDSSEGDGGAGDNGVGKDRVEDGGGVLPRRTASPCTTSLLRKYQ